MCNAWLKQLLVEDSSTMPIMPTRIGKISDAEAMSLQRMLGYERQELVVIIKGTMAHLSPSELRAIGTNGLPKVVVRALGHLAKSLPPSRCTSELQHMVQERIDSFVATTSATAAIVNRESAIDATTLCNDEASAASAALPLDFSSDKDAMREPHDNIDIDASSDAHDGEHCKCSRESSDNCDSLPQEDGVGAYADRAVVASATSAPADSEYMDQGVWVHVSESGEDVEICDVESPPNTIDTVSCLQQANADVDTISGPSRAMSSAHVTQVAGRSSLLLALERRMRPPSKDDEFYCELTAATESRN